MASDMDGGDAMRSVAKAMMMVNTTPATIVNGSDSSILDIATSPTFVADLEGLKLPPLYYYGIRGRYDNTLNRKVKPD